MNIIEILKIKYPDAKNIFDYQVAINSKGDQYISVWNLSSEQPTAEDLLQWNNELDLQLRQSDAVDKRIYPSINAQLDMLYHDKINNTTIWEDTITAIKAANPKPLV